MALLARRSTGPETKQDVVKIVLFTITGAILAFFAGMVIVGVIRAYRHPDRYLPQPLVGQPRPNRAKGITRAILDTIPIVSLRAEGKSPPDPESPLELSEQARKKIDNRIQQGALIHVAQLGDQLQTAPEPVPDESDMASAADDMTHLRCSVCTEDFHLGEQVRVLPCNHKYHPTCIDPWLLNMSSTCPLCRIDLDHKRQSLRDDRQTDA